MHNLNHLFKNGKIKWLLQAFISLKTKQKFSPSKSPIMASLIPLWLLKFGSKAGIGSPRKEGQPSAEESAILASIIKVFSSTNQNLIGWSRTMLRQGGKENRDPKFWWSLDLQSDRRLGRVFAKSPGIVCDVAMAVTSSLMATRKTWRNGLGKLSDVGLNLSHIGWNNRDITRKNTL